MMAVKETVLIVTVSVVHCHEGKNEDAVKAVDETEHSWNWKEVDDYLKNKGSFACPSVYGRYPHPRECTLYYECRFSVPHIMQCSHGQLYDEKKEQCRDQRHVNCNRCCKDGDNGSKDEKKEDKTLVFRCPYIWGTFAHPFDCSKYYECIYNVPKLFQCEGTDLFDTRNKKCNDKSRVDCGNRLDRDQLRPTTVAPTTPPPTVGPPTTEDQNKFTCPFPSGRFPDPRDCSQFYECRFSIPTLYRCPQGTLYDERHEVCLDHSRVNCGNRPGGKGGDDETGKEGVRCPCTWGTFSLRDDCSKYMICMYNVPTVFNCRKNELFHAYHKRCLPSNQVVCDNRINPDILNPPPTTTTTTTTTTPVPTTTTTTPVPTTTTTTPIPTTTTTTPIPTTTTTTPIPTTTTTTPEPTTTPTTTTALPTTTSPATNRPKPNTPPPTDCDDDDIDCIEDETGDVRSWFDCPERYGHFPHAGHIQLFIHCDNWRPFIKRCNVDTAFSPQFLVCVWIGKPIPKYTKNPQNIDY